ncbi:MAG: YihA family ribosome biogenesis GTP-binding protein [Alphaproteobacteria bacterium GWF2_58_20]|nr:MAG: YihA family ribosome biogenesis GTP-binding protein [Alphaproteobacteria bacterium GWF2_58_20]
MLEADAEDIAYGQKLFSLPCTFIMGAVKPEGLPTPTLPEIAFAGRSNVGKSSLVNAMVGRRALARVSNTPGRTREINFFNLADKLMIVDLPGYGYAELPAKKVKMWTGLTRAYLRGRVNLRRVCLLIDSRHGFKKNDIAIMDLFDESAVPFLVVLTKTDKIKAAELETRIAECEKTLKKHPAAFPSIMATSSEKHRGLDELRALLSQDALT